MSFNSHPANIFPLKMASAVYVFCVQNIQDVHFRLILSWKQTLLTLIRLQTAPLEQSDLGPYYLQYRFPNSGNPEGVHRV